VLQLSQSLQGSDTKLEGWGPERCLKDSLGHGGRRGLGGHQAASVAVMSHGQKVTAGPKAELPARVRCWQQHSKKAVGDKKDKKVATTAGVTSHEAVKCSSAGAMRTPLAAGSRSPEDRAPRVQGAGQEQGAGLPAPAWCPRWQLCEGSAAEEGCAGTSRGCRALPASWGLGGLRRNRQGPGEVAAMGSIVATASLPLPGEGEKPCPVPLSRLQVSNQENQSDAFLIPSLKIPAQLHSRKR